MLTIYSSEVRRFGDSANISGVSGTSYLLHDNAGYAEFITQNDTTTIYKPVYADIPGYEYYLEDEIPSNSTITGLEYKFQVGLPSIPWSNWKFQATPMLGSTEGNNSLVGEGNITLGGPNDLLGLSPTVSANDFLNLGIKFTLTLTSGVSNGPLKVLGSKFSGGSPSPTLIVYYQLGGTRVEITNSTITRIGNNTRVSIQDNNS